MLNDIIYKIRVLIQKNRIKVEDIKITIEFANATTYYEAEKAFRMQSQGISIDTKTADDVCSGREFTYGGIKFVVKEPDQMKYLPACGCSSCQSMRTRALAREAYKPIP